MGKNHIKTSELIFDLLNFVILLSFLFICAYPFYYIIIYSISDSASIKSGIGFIPSGITFKNYTTIFKLPGLLNATAVSSLRTAVGSTLTVFASSLLAYIITKENLPFRKIIYRFLIITMYLSGGLIPWYLTLKAYHLTNTFFVYVIPTAISAYYVILIKTFIEQLPPSLEESAKIDGAGYLTIFFRIIFPLSMPIIATIYVFSAVWQWNSYFDNYILVTSAKLQTLQLILYNYLQQANRISHDMATIGATLANRATPYAVKMTITVVITFPILFVYPFAQRFFVKGILLGAVKG